ncbi:MAG: tetratricopeptide repeat protein [Chloroflexi bacterium]|nr:tetratricopeptide repeat protein [Chloroflexota bacterium]
MPTLSITEKLLGAILEYLKKGGENLIKDATAKKAIKEAIERAAERFGNEYSNQGLAKALVVSTRFHDLPSVQEAIRQVLQHPFDPVPQVELENEFSITLPQSQKKLAGEAAQAYLEILREELIGVEKLNDKLKLIYLRRTADATERTADGVKELVEMQKKSSTEKKSSTKSTTPKGRKSPSAKSVVKQIQIKPSVSNLILHFQKISQNAEFDAPIPVTVEFEDSTTEVFDFINPLTDKNLSELRWYLENYWQWPSDIDDERAREVEGKLPKWGKALMDAIIQKSSDAMRLFGRFSEADGERMLTIDTTEPRILRLPWELLRDEGGYLFSEQISVRRRMHKVKPQTVQPFDLPVRILMVTCRPDGAGFIDPRSIATPLLDALDSLPEQFEVEFLRPPTLKALDERLRDETQPRVHIVHFDGHGVYDKGVGLGFLLFEDESHQKHLVDAEQLGTLLNRSGIPLMVLNACQSAQPDDRNPFASVASRLIESGVGGVVAMNYSVLVETAKRFTQEFYGALARGQSANAAMDSARRNLFADTKRLTLRRPHEEDAIIVHLQDWFLPALYQQAEELKPFAAPSRPTTEGTESTEKKENLRALRGLRGGFPPAPLHGFHGRARELLDLERAFATRNVVVLHGFGGQGKTSLATQAAEWFTRTHLFERAAFISFETGASFDFVLNELGNALVEENFQIYDGDKIEAIAQALREHPTLLVWDNFESVLPKGNAPLKDEDLQALLNAGAKWASQRNSRLLITTRNDKVPHDGFIAGKNCLHKELEGLALGDALDLAASILESNGLARPARVPLEELLKFLKGHPLSLQLALPQLRTYSAEALLEQYQTILPQMKTGEAKERNESLEVSLRFSLDRLGADAVNLLSRLWVFEGGAMEHILLAITEIPEEAWNALKPQLTSTALIRVEEVAGVNVPFIHFHPTLAPYLKATIDNDPSQSPEAIENRKSEIVNRYWQIYYSYANQLYQDDTQHPIPVRAIVLRELPNLKRALKLTLAADALDEAVEFADSINKFLNAFGRWRERDEIAKAVERAVNSDQSSVGSGKMTKRETLLEYGRGDRLLQQGRAGEAEKVFRALLARLEGEAAYDTRYDQTIILRNIGLSLRAQGHPSQAADFYRRAIALTNDQEQNKDVKNTLASCHGDLADALADSGQYVEARKEYETALAISKETDNDRHQGVFLGQLGTLAMRQGDLNEARKRHLEALGLFQRMGEDQMEAVAWHQLGVVAQTEGERVGAQHAAPYWDEAERCYKESVNIKEHLGDLAGVARTSNQLAIVAESAGRFDESERWARRSLEIKEKSGNPKDIAIGNHKLAVSLLNLGRLDEATKLIEKAITLYETVQDFENTVKAYATAAELAEKRGHMDEVRAWRRKEQESRMEFERLSGGQANTSGANIRTQVDKWNPIIAEVVKTCRNETELSPELNQFLDEQAKTDDWRNLIAVIRRVLSGERGMDLLDGLDQVDSAIIRRILHAFSDATADGGQQTVENGPSSTVHGQAQQQEQGVTLPQLLELVERAARGDQQLGGQLFNAFQGMARADDPAMRALGNVLLRVLVGDHNPDLSALPDEVASLLRGMLGRLKNS